MNAQIFSIEPLFNIIGSFFILSVPVVIFLVKFMFRFRVSLLIFNQFLILIDPHCIGVSFDFFCFTAVSSAYKYMFTEFVISGKSFIN